MVGLCESIAAVLRDLQALAVSFICSDGIHVLVDHPVREARVGHDLRIAAGVGAGKQAL